MANKKIMAEWRILKKDLPESIYVRTYETRMDLVRAVIFGAEGTPYENGLFFFDIKFPDNYPNEVNEPPMVHYRSHGLKLNPNLYSNGKVCLSLLNTWYGKGSENWDPFQSTLLQVLVSIQALVLNEKPLLNEQGFGFLTRWFGMKGMSQNYNDDAFIATCRSTLYLLQNPSKNFETFTAKHFRGRASRILRACDDYSKHGYYNKESEAGPSVSKVSKEFKESMEHLYPQLVKAFEKNEAQLVKASKKNEASPKNKKNDASLKKNRAERSLTTLIDQVKKKIELAATPGRLFVLSGALLVSAFVAASLAGDRMLAEITAWYSIVKV
ncbi:PREDICTED: putative ubiquitin-conjugating enzyme E2 38 [Fragaria vesca subsp. vesca]|uniref:putative ubiquitin-conjugating enzyme E2 38 n=1 Tax=Fragaria vesca subsp. vesca TaxID=101020 RepID=UPI0002C2E402|nr:PREDICTED: putative ubiquitin-conjugating enzyme E2 38 [Fragaria vesca subsp. vesca]